MEQVISDLTSRIGKIAKKVYSHLIKKHTPYPPVHRAFTRLESPGCQYENFGEFAGGIARFIG
jgi:hypothetical protein